MRAHKSGRSRGRSPVRSRGRGVEHFSPNDESFLPRIRSAGRDYLHSRRDSGYLSSYKENGFLPSPRATEERYRSYSRFFREDGQRAHSVGDFIETHCDHSPTLDEIQRSQGEYMPSHREFANMGHHDLRSGRKSKEVGRSYSPHLSEIQRTEPEYAPSHRECGSRDHTDLRSGRETMERQHGSLQTRHPLEEASTSFAMEIDRSGVSNDFWGERGEYEMKYDKNQYRDRGIYLGQQSHFDDHLPQGESYYTRLHSGHYSHEPPKLDREDKCYRGYATTSSERDKGKHQYEHNFSNIDGRDMPDRKISMDSRGARELSDYYSTGNFPRTLHIVGKSSSELENNNVPCRERNNIYFNCHLPQCDNLSREGYMLDENTPANANGEPRFGFHPFEAKSSNIGSSYDAYKSFTSPSRQHRSDGMLNDPNPYDGYDTEFYEYSANSKLKSSDLLDGHDRELTQMHGKARDYICSDRNQGHPGPRDDYHGRDLISLGAEDSILTRLKDDSTTPVHIESRLLEDQCSQEHYLNHDYVGRSSNMKMHDEEFFGSGNCHPEYWPDLHKVYERSNLTDSGWSNGRVSKKSKVSKFTYKPGFDRRSGTSQLNMYRPSKEPVRRVQQANKLSQKHKHSNFENAESLFLSKRSKLGLVQSQKVRRLGDTFRHKAGKLQKLSKLKPMLRSTSGGLLHSRLSAKKHERKIMNRIIDGSYENACDDDYSPSKSDRGLTRSEPPEGSKNFRHLVHSAFLKFIKQLNEDPDERRKYIEQAEAGMLRCIACDSNTKEFTNTENLVVHTFATTASGSRSQHLGLHQALCLLMGWNYDVAPENTWFREELPEAECSAIREDLIIWPPVVIVHDMSVRSDGSPSKDIKPTPDMLKTYLQEVGFGKALVRACWGKRVMVVAFRGTLTGLDEAERLHKFFDEKKQGRGGVVRNDRGVEGDEAGVGSVICGYLGIAWDFDKLVLEMKKGLVVRSRREIRAIAEADVSPD